jgi:RNA polymerase subunit RPABC4/transcription elongation factor Spt4
VRHSIERLRFADLCPACGDEVFAALDGGECVFTDEAVNDLASTIRACSACRRLLGGAPETEAEYEKRLGAEEWSAAERSAELDPLWLP